MTARLTRKIDFHFLQYVETVACITNPRTRDIISLPNTTFKNVLVHSIESVFDGGFQDVRVVRIPCDSSDVVEKGIKMTHPWGIAALLKSIVEVEI